jgi:hypothetical protein
MQWGGAAEKLQGKSVQIPDPPLSCCETFLEAAFQAFPLGTETIVCLHLRLYLAAHPLGQALVLRGPVTMAQSPYGSSQNAKENLVVAITGFVGN